MNITIYINRQNEELFKAEAEKSKLLNELLANHYAGFRGMPNPRKDSLPPVKVLPNVAIPGLVKGSEFVPKPPDPETGYPCCLGKRPCKHWVWDGNVSAYVNSLTGKEREAEL